MSKFIKNLITEELTQRYAEANNAVWVEMLGVDGITTNEFRRDLRSKQMRLEVVKTSLLRRACKGKALSRLADALDGPAALVTAVDPTAEVSSIDMAKALEPWEPKLKEKLRLRGAVLEGEFLDEGNVKGLAQMPTKRDLQGRVVSQALSPGGKLVSALLSGGSNIAGCLKALIEKLEKGSEN